MSSTSITTGLVLELTTPAPVSCIDLRKLDSALAIIVGTEDGTLRRYDYDAQVVSNKPAVQKAVRLPGRSISWVRFSERKGEEEFIWITVGMSVRRSPLLAHSSRC